jgi:methylenetetrahydrofolate reductase (NADPH)
MSFAQALIEGRFPVALEITPPQRSLPRVLLRRARALDPVASAINVIQRPDRQSSLEASIELLAAGITPTWHLSTRGRTLEELKADLQTAHQAGITQLLCLLGDHPADPSIVSPTIRDAIALACETLPGCLAGATLNQYTPSRESALKNLFPKLRAGAKYIQTQPVFDLETLRPYAEAVREAEPAVSIVPMAMPLLTADAAQRIEKRLGVSLPAALHTRIAASEDEAWRAFTETVASLVESPLVDAVALMTFETDPSPETAQRLIRALAEAGVPAAC